MTQTLSAGTPFPSTAAGAAGSGWVGIERLLVANRGEIALRILRTATELGVATVAVHTPDDAGSTHLALADDVRVLPTRGVAGYLDIPAVIEAARASGADSVHPGYGFLAESAELARACEAAGLRFVGPRPDLLDLFGDKLAARRAAAAAGLPVLAGSDGPATIEQAAALLAEHGAVMLKAVAGGGGRGMRVVRSADQLESAWARCTSEAVTAFGRGDVYAERLVPVARHVEVQIVGDGTGAAVHLGERDCSVQRRNQKILEIAPAPGLSDELRHRITGAAVALARSVRYTNVGTVEFLVAAPTHDGETPVELGADADLWFIETNARIQVEHTVTEEVTGLDLVEIQLRLAAGATLANLGLAGPGDGSGAPVTGWALQARINAETIDPSGLTRPAAGTITTFEPAAGPGVRVDTAAHQGMVVNPAYDSLLAKLIVHRRSGSFDGAANKLYRALCETRIEGVDTNLDLLRSIVGHPLMGGATTGFLESNLADLLDAVAHPRLHAGAGTGGGHGSPSASAPPAQAGARLDSDDPLAVLAFGQRQTAPGAPGGAGAAAGSAAPDPEGTLTVRTPLQGTVVTVEVAVGDPVAPGQLVAVVEAMKMEHEVRAPAAGVVASLAAAPGDTLWADQALVVLGNVDHTATAVEVEAAIDLDEIRPSLAQVLALRARMMDEARPDAVARRRATNQRTARENLADLVDDGTFVEYGPMALAAQRRRRTREDLIVKSPADGLITGVGSVNGDQFGEPDNRCAVMIYDYTVFAGTQGIRNHAKTDRIIDIAAEGRMPLILFAEGGGGRPGDTDGGDFGSRTFSRFATLSGLVPMVAVVSGRCYAGNASLLGCCDVIIATRNANIGMGGPAMIQGGGLGVFRPEEIGPVEVQTRSGVIDVLVDDEAEATRVAKQYLSYFQGSIDHWEAREQRRLRHVVPENRLRSYEIRHVIDNLVDIGSWLELRPLFGVGMITGLARIEGRPIGIIANNPNHLGGAIDSDGSDKGARFMQLCDAFDIPILFLCDTPGIMVGPEIEKTALVRHSSRMFLIGANLDVPTFTVIVRKSYGLGGIAMAGGSYKVPVCTVAWPTAEFGAMGLEGSVKLGFRDVLAAIEDPAERKAKYDELVAKEYVRGGALNYATGFALDDTIDPAETRHWLGHLMASIRPPSPRTHKKRASVDGW
ncbi:MAG: ATP-grasp domain-containing protein [Acidimicrobiia bacterium]|nr:ATP-grasp domain-containing protein [Acidimicrobiia bacterium]